MSSPARGFKEFDGIAGRIVDEDLLAAHPGDDLVSEVDSRLAQRLDFARQVVDLELDAIPPTWLGLATIGHGLGGSSGAAGRAQQEAEVAACHDRETRGGPERHAEAEPLGVEGNGRIHVMDDVPHGNWRHVDLLVSRRLPLPLAGCGSARPEPVGTWTA